jgi:hypothetical protein
MAAVDSGKRAGLSSGVAEKMKPLSRRSESFVRANGILGKASA